MKKTIIIAIIVVVLIGAVLLVVFSRNSSHTPQQSGVTGELPYVGTSSINVVHPTGTTLQLGTPQGTVVVNNFYNSPVQVSQDNTSVLIVQSSTFNITYYSPDSSFNIGILKGPVSSVQPQAEAAFLTQLGISKSDACKLNIAIGIPASVDPNYAGRNLGLSFCGGGAFQEK